MNKQLSYKILLPQISYKVYKRQLCLTSLKISYLQMPFLVPAPYAVCWLSPVFQLALPFLRKSLRKQVCLVTCPKGHQIQALT